MDNVINLINHLLNTKYSIDRIDTIIDQLQIRKDYLLQLINDSSYTDYFQLLQPSNNRNQGSEKIALTLDLFCCTHYAQHCKNESCPFLHLCPYNIRPMHTKCTNKTCPYDHDILKSIHNRKIIDARGLSFIPARILHELTRASADPRRSFWVCTDHGKKSGCSKKSNCDKLHYCYYALIDACTKPHCQHGINDACLAYFRQKELIEQDYGDVLDAFRKVLRQRKPDYVNKVNMPNQSPSTLKFIISNDNQRKSTTTQQRCTSSSSKRSTSMASGRELSSYDDVLSSKSDTSLPSPLPEHDQDILLLGYYDKNEYEDVERYLSDEIGCPIKLLISKNILSENKEKQCSNIRAKPIYYYCPTKNPADIFQLLRWQNEDKESTTKPLIVYASVRDAHDAAEQNFENNQFCIFRVHLFHSGIINGNLLPENRLQLSDPLTMCFDRMWVYIYNL
ncbi:unnamed protein product [Rotaria sordida]|uniref:Uncharacterized protein n=2 Tax=Rotaria sordida TaxID=392033 RepID=A0A813XG69_9BILA|nr:unnamed protein product [Rotaria sordida]CAF0894909.1 unnamed protein product [Rotaria sordida]CAF3704022.1 unnamed protein product [Rotaria sordida]